MVAIIPLGKHVGISRCTNQLSWARQYAACWKNYSVAVFILVVPYDTREEEGRSASSIPWSSPPKRNHAPRCVSSARHWRRSSVFPYSGFLPRRLAGRSSLQRQSQDCFWDTFRPVWILNQAIQIDEGSSSVPTISATGVGCANTSRLSGDSGRHCHSWMHSAKAKRTAEFCSRAAPGNRTPKPQNLVSKGPRGRRQNRQSRESTDIQQRLKLPSSCILLRKIRTSL